MKTLFIFFIVLTLCTPLYAVEFRNASWSMSREEVLASEQQDAFQEGTSNLGSQYISYLLDLRVDESTHEMLAVYYFIHDALYFAKYRVLTVHSNQNEYITDFEIFTKIISKRYGEADIKINWKDTTFQSEKSLWGTAIAFGGLEYTAFWETERTMILLRLNGDNGEIKFEIRYSTKDARLKAMVDAVKANQEAAQF